MPHNYIKLECFMSTYDSRIVIEPAENGFIVTVESEEGTSVNVFTRRRQLMHYIGANINKIKPDDSDDAT